MVANHAKLTVKTDTYTAAISPRSPRAATPISFVRAMCAGAIRCGHDPFLAMDSAHITEAQLNETCGLITANQMERVSGQLMRELDDEALGWFHRQLPWGTYGMLARASLSSPNLLLALRRWCRHHKLVTDDISLNVFDMTSGQTCIALQEANAGPWLTGEMREFCHVSMLRNLIGVGSWLVDSQLPLAGVEMVFDRPLHHCAYTTLFKAPVTFNAPCTKLLLDAQYMELPIRRSESDLNRMLKRALPLTVRHYRPDRLLPERVRQLLAFAPSDFRNAESVAIELSLSVRTLHRQLAAHRTSLQKLKDEVRMEQASALLLRTGQPVKVVAGLVGFENQKAFSRAYKRQTGHTPGQVKKQPKL